MELLVIKDVRMAVLEIVAMIVNVIAAQCAVPNVQEVVITIVDWGARTPVILLVILLVLVIAVTIVIKDAL